MSWDWRKNARRDFLQLAERPRRGLWLHLLIGLLVGTFPTVVLMALLNLEFRDDTGTVVVLLLLVGALIGTLEHIDHVGKVCQDYLRASDPNSTWIP